jgi:hypothetical protein
MKEQKKTKYFILQHAYSSDLLFLTAGGDGSI